MRWPRIIFLSSSFCLLGAFLHYTLPQRDIVRITETQLQLTEISGWSALFYAQSDSGAEGTSVQRDVRIISAVRPDNTPIDYRNEDTGLFGWPPYFKIDSQDVQTEAQDLRSTRDIAGNGWPSPITAGAERVLDPTPMRCPSGASMGRMCSLFPWLNIVILLGMVLVIFMAWRIWERFEDRVIEPFLDGVAVRWAKMKDWSAGRR
jgi:hypothetical protein